MGKGDALFDPATGERKYLNREERRAFFQATLLEEADVKYYCQLIYYTGCRTSEALQLSPARLDYSSNMITFRNLKQGKDRNGIEIVRYRQNELPESYLHELQGVYGILKRQKSKAAAKAPLWGFTDRTGYNYVTRVMAKAGITGSKATPRGLRHSMGVSLVLAKVPVSTVQRVLGHASISNTIIYLDVIEDERREMVSQVW
jgi:site-specific recombinase XerD